MQVTTSCRMRRPGSWKSTSLVTTVGTRIARGKIGQLVQAKLVVRPPAQRRAPDRRGRRRPRAAGAGAARSRSSALSGHEDGDQALAIGDEIGPVEIALGFAGALLAERQQPAQPGIGRPIGRIDQDGHAVAEIEAAADDQAHAGGLGGLMGADDAGERVAVDDGQRLDAHRGGRGEQLLAGGGAAQEAEMRGHLQLGVARAAHPKIPCRNQRCEPVSGSSPSPAR